MLQHLLFLRPSIEGVSVTTENLVFKLVYAVSCPIFLAFGAIFYTRICFLDPINCLTNSTESFKVLRAVDSHCLENAFIDTGEGPLYQSHYQYVGLFFILCGALCYFPYVLWEWFENGLLKALLQDLMSVNLVVEEKKLSRQIHDFVLVWRKNRKMLEYYASANILCEIANLLSLFCIFWLSDLLLSGRFTFFGLQFLSEADRVFPKTAFCSWDAMDVVYSGVCTMNLNYLSEKLFFTTWWWLTTLMMLTLGNLTYRFCLLRNVDLRAWTIAEGNVHVLGEFHKKCSVTARTERDKENDNAVAYVKGLSYGEFFMLKRVQANVPPSTFSTLLQKLEETQEKTE